MHYLNMTKAIERLGVGSSLDSTHRLNEFVDQTMAANNAKSSRPILGNRGYGLVLKIDAGHVPHQEAFSFVFVQFCTHLLGFRPIFWCMICPPWPGSCTSLVST